MAATPPLRVQRPKKAAELEALDGKLQAATDADFMSRVGSADLKTLTLRERSEIVSKIGYEKFKALLGVA